MGTWVRKWGSAGVSWIHPSLRWGTLHPSVLSLGKTEKFMVLSTFFCLLVYLPEVGMPQHGDRAEQRHLLLLSGLPPAILGPRGPGQARGAPLGDILTPRERALLRATEPRVRSPQQPPASRLKKEVSSPTRGAGFVPSFVPSPVGLLTPPVPQGEPSQGHPRAPELLEAHKHHVAEIRARTQELEQQRAGRCSGRGFGAMGLWFVG